MFDLVQLGQFTLRIGQYLFDILEKFYVSKLLRDELFEVIISTDKEVG